VSVDYELDSDLKFVDFSDLESGLRHRLGELDYITVSSAPFEIR